MNIRSGAVRKYLSLVIVLSLAGCAEKQQRAVNEAFIVAQEKRAEAAIQCGKRRTAVATCMLGLAAIYGGGAAQAGPTVVPSDLAVVLNSPVIAGLGAAAINSYTQIKVSEDNRLVAINASNDNRDVSMNNINAFAALGGEAVRAVERVGNSGLAAATSIAGTGFRSMEGLGIAAFNANGYTVQSFSDLIRNMPVTYQLGAGAIFGNDNTALNGSGYIDQSFTGDDRDSPITCTLRQAYSFSATQTSQVTGTIGATGSGLGINPVPLLPANVVCGE